MEDGFRSTLKKDKNCDDEEATTVQKGVYSMKHMVVCTHASCSLHVHSDCIDSDKFIFFVLQFKGLSCFEIAHKNNTAGSWLPNPNFEYKMPRKKWKGLTGKPRGQKTVPKSSFSSVHPPHYSVSTSHPIYLLLCEKYGVDKKGKGTLKDKLVIC